VARRASPSASTLCPAYTAPTRTDFYTLSLHDALPISLPLTAAPPETAAGERPRLPATPVPRRYSGTSTAPRKDHQVSTSFERVRSEEHTSELQSRENLVCRLLLEKKKHDEHADHGDEM